MKVTFNYTDTPEGYKLNMKCSDLTVLEHGAYDKKEYIEAFKAILEYIIVNKMIYE